MKKLMKAWAVLAAAAMLGTSFISCGGADDDGGGSKPSGTGGNYDTVVPARLAKTAPAAAGEVKIDGTPVAGIKEAFAAIADNGEHTITLEAGTYDLGTDQINYNGGATIHVKGLGNAEYGTDVVITTAREELASEESRSLLYVAGAANIYLENLTLENSNKKVGDAQFEVVGYAGSGTIAAYNCSFLSHQDTMRTTGKAWFYKCYIEGDVDFLWMEEAGSVALYENCRLRAVKDRIADDGSCNAYFTAPRVSVADEKSYYKGLVIINSKFEVEDGVTCYLGRNPWNKSGSIYNNVSIVNSTLAGKLVSAFKNAGNANPAIPFSGFHTDTYFAADSNSSRYSAEMVANEFAGRNNIINRYFDGEVSAMAKASSLWDVNALATKLGWDVTEDTSLAVLPTEKPTNVYSYSFVGATDSGDGTYTTADGNVTVKPAGFRTDVHGVTIHKDDTITLKVATMCKISFIACQYGQPFEGTATTDAGAFSDGNATTTFKIDPSAVDGGTSGAIFYTGTTPATITLTFTQPSECYLHGVGIREYAEFNKATEITVSGKNSLLIDSTTQLSATIAPTNVTLKAVEWSSSDETVALVSKKGLVQGLKAGTAEITCSSTDGSGVKGSITVTVTENTNKPVAGKEYFYNLKGGVGNPYFSDDTFFQMFADADNGGHGLQAGEGTYIKLKVAGNCEIDFHNCRYDNAMDVIATNSKGDVVGSVHFPGQEKYASEPQEIFKLDDYHTTLAYVGPADTLTLTYTNAGKTASYLHDLTVKPLTNINSVTGITVTAADNATTVKAKGTLQLSAAVTPAEATSKTVSWSSSDETIATVSSAGVVTGVAKGPVTITATAIDGSNVTGTIDLTVTVADPEPGVTYDYDLKGGKGFPFVSEDTFLSISGSGNDNVGHGFNLDGGSVGTLKVAGNVKVTLYTCAYDKASSVAVTTSAEEAVATVDIPAGDSSNDTTTQVFYYNGSADTLTLKWTGNCYLHGMKVEPTTMIAKDAFIDLRTLNEAGCTAGGSTQTKDVGLVHIAAMYWKDAQHGAWFYKTSSISLTVKGPCTVYLAKNPYNGTSYAISTEDSTKLSATTVDAKVENSSGTIAANCTDLSSDAENPSFKYTGTGEAVITIALTDTSNQAYLPAVQVKY